MPYHPSQQIDPKYEMLFSDAILSSLLESPPMVGKLPHSALFEVAKEDAKSIAKRADRALRFNQKLGHLYEDAMLSLLNASCRFKPIKNNFQIITPDKRTIGELDFILWDNEKNAYIHLELAVKFYLVHKTDKLINYPGPDARDNYARKLARLTDHQLTLTNQPQTKKVLESITGGSACTIMHLVHGILFDHIHSQSKPLPKFASTACRRRKWLYCNELMDHCQNITQVKVLPKQLWLSTMTPEIYDSLVEISSTELLSLGQERCTMFVEHLEAEPMFLAPDRWPSQS